MKRTFDLNVERSIPLSKPWQIKNELPMNEVANGTVVLGREAIRAILRGKDDRMLVVVGPCSIHDEAAALEYARRLLALRERVEDRMFVVMRVYFEKPRTVLGWKGLIYDPHLDGSFDIEGGLRKARRILLEITGMGVPAATEMLDPITPQYIADLISWGSIGARTTESQTHRQMTSGLSMPIGFKNSTDGNLQVAIDAMRASRSPQTFIGIDTDGVTCNIKTRGNPDSHLILRGGRSGPNFEAAHVARAREALTGVGLDPAIMIDCNHANSGKVFGNQAGVWNDVLEQRMGGDGSIIGMMLESNLNEGNQPLKAPGALQYGVSITDACLGWDATETLLLAAHDRLSQGQPAGRP